MEDREGLCGIYCITNVVDGKRYIGQTMRSFKERWRNHAYELNRGTHRNSYLQRAWDKHGELYFSFDVFEICDTVEQCNESEIFWIYTFKALNRKHGYNLKSGGANGKPSDITKQRMSIAQSGENNAMFGRKATTQAKQKMSKAKLGISKSIETKLRMSIGRLGEKNHRFGKEKPKEIKDKMSYNAIGKKKNSTSGYIGVYCHANSCKWIAQVRINSKVKSLGYFTDKIEAAKAYDAASWEAYGRLDILNFPEDYKGQAMKAG